MSQGSPPCMKIAGLFPGEYRDDFCVPFQSRCVRKLAGSANHLIRLEQQDQFALPGCFHRQVTRLGALEGGPPPPPTSSPRPFRPSLPPRARGRDSHGTSPSPARVAPPGFGRAAPSRPLRDPPASP